MFKSSKIKKYELWILIISSCDNSRIFKSYHLELHTKIFIRHYFLQNNMG